MYLANRPRWPKLSCISNRLRWPIISYLPSKPKWFILCSYQVNLDSF
jgi:hypothetical protein